MTWTIASCGLDSRCVASAAHFDVFGGPGFPVNKPPAGAAIFRIDVIATAGGLALLVFARVRACSRVAIIEPARVRQVGNMARIGAMHPPRQSHSLH